MSRYTDKVQGFEERIDRRLQPRRSAVRYEVNRKLRRKVQALRLLVGELGAFMPAAPPDVLDELRELHAQLGRNLGRQPAIASGTVEIPDLDE